MDNYFLQDLLANPKCSLLVAKDPEDRTDLVITVHGDAVSVSSSSLQLCIMLLFIISRKAQVPGSGTFLISKF